MSFKKAGLYLITTTVCLFLFVNQLAVSANTAVDSRISDKAAPTMLDNSQSSQMNSSPSTAVYIRLQQAVFDPLQEEPPTPSGLNRTAVSASGPDYYFVQFAGPILAEWRADLEKQGAEIMDYVPDFAYIVRMDEQTLDRVTQLQTIRWVGLYQPVFRLSNDLIATTNIANPDQTTQLIIRAFPGEPVDTLSKQISDLGITIIEQYADSGGGAIFKADLPETTIANLAFIPGIAWIEPALEPQLANSVARSNSIMGKDEIESVLGLYGAGQMVAVGDSGLDTGNPATAHQDFAGRIFGGTWGPGDCGTWADNHSHGTHVAGSVLGSGALSGSDIPNQNYSGSHAGTAPEALLYVWSFCNNFSGLPVAPYANYYGTLYNVDSRLRISTNSWGYSSNQGQYNTFTRETDRFVRDHPDMVLTYAAGNAGTDGNSNGVVDLNSMNMPGTGKNVITVGASENVQAGNAFTWGSAWPTRFPVAPIFGDLVADNADGMAAFSSRGPTLSNRIKPDIVAPGTNIVSTRNYSIGTGWGVFDANYLYMGGTSMATPLVAGAAAIVREYYTTIHSINPTAALVKATFINGAYDMTPGQYGGGATQEITRRPDNVQGWGRVDLPNTLVYTGGRQLWFHEHAGLNTGGSYQVTFDVLDTGPFRATLVWTDYPGTEGSHGALVNDLDLVVEDPNGTIYLGNEALTGSRDATNNVEGVDLMPINGTYTVTVSGFNVPQGSQSFALVVTAPGPVGYLTGLVDDGVNPIAGATVTAVLKTPFITDTNGAGTYTMTLPVGNYDVMANAAGYAPAVVNNIAIVSGTITTQDFTLVPLPPAPAPFTTCVVPNVAIPDGDPAGIDNTLAITQTEGIADLNLYIRATHTWVGDLIFTLTHPDNSTSVIAIDRPGHTTTGFGCSGNDIDVWVDDEGADTAIENQCSNLPAISGRAIGGDPPSATLLATFDGLPADGIWTLNASDNANGDTGTLNEWCLEITPASDYIWQGIEDSDWNNVNNWAGGAVPGATDSVVLDPSYLTGAMAWPVLEVDPTVDNLTVEADAELTIPAGRTLTVNGTLTNNGTLRQSIDTVNAATTFLGTGGYGGVEINPAGNMGLTTVLIRGNQNCTTDNTSQSVQRCFNITPDTDQTATIRFYYGIDEANGNPENGVSVYHWNGTAWDLEMGTYDHSSGDDPRWVEVTGVSNYSPFVLDNVVPTAVSLANIGVKTAVSPSIILILLLLVVGTAVGLARRRQTA